MDPMVAILGLSLIAGLVGGFTAGLLGLGGGLVMVPIMNYVLPVGGVPERRVMHAALVISLATMIYNTGSAAFLRWRQAQLPLGIFARLAPAVLLGAVIGAAVADRLSSQTLRVVFLSYISVVIVKELRSDLARPKAGTEGAKAGSAGRLPPNFLTAPYFTATGAVGAILGIGGALLTIPFLTGAGFAIPTAAALASAVGSVVASVGTVAYVAFGQNAVGMPPYSFGYLYLPAFAGMLAGATIGSPLGVRLSRRLSKATLKLLFIATIIVVVVSMVTKLVI